MPRKCAAATISSELIRLFLTVWAGAPSRDLASFYSALRPSAGAATYCTAKGRGRERGIAAANLRGPSGGASRPRIPRASATTARRAPSFFVLPAVAQPEAVSAPRQPAEAALCEGRASPHPLNAG